MKNTKEFGTVSPDTESDEFDPKITTTEPGAWGEDASEDEHPIEYGEEEDENEITHV